VVPALPLEVTFHPAAVSFDVPEAASPGVDVPFRTTSVVLPWSDGVAAAGSDDEDDEEPSDGDEDEDDEADDDADADGADDESPVNE